MNIKKNKNKKYIRKANERRGGAVEGRTAQSEFDGVGGGGGGGAGGGGLAVGGESKTYKIKNVYSL